MTEFELIQDNLNQFTKKYYLRLLIKGLILFVCFGFLLFMLVTGIEYFLWLKTTGRFMLLIFLVLTELLLLYYWIAIPILYLFKLKKGITQKEASALIGKHFSSVDDKLYNLLQLSDEKQKSDLLRASINQRSYELRPINFANAIDFTEAITKLKYLALPIILLVVLVFLGEFSTFFNSYTRVRNFDVAYAPPAPFQFSLLNERFDFLRGEEVVVRMNTIGKIRPDNVVLNHNGNQYVMQFDGVIFYHNFSSIVDSGIVFFEANGFRSKQYLLNIHEVPSIQEMEVQLLYPKYLKKQNEVLKGTGNAQIPEGTKAIWSVTANNTETIGFRARDTTRYFKKDKNFFKHEQTLMNSLGYLITTSNANANDYESLGYRLDVVKDAYPAIRVVEQKDSLNFNAAYYSGQVTDDYSVRSLSVVYSEIDNPRSERRVTLSKPNAAVSTFLYTFPDGLTMTKGTVYQLYFEVTDNDALRGGKTTKSRMFTLSTYDGNQLKDKELEGYKSVLKGFENTIGQLEEQDALLNKINEEQKQQQQMDFNDKMAVKQFLEKQKAQEQLMKKFSEALKNSLDKDGEKNEMDELLKERLERQEKAAQKNHKLLEELEKIADKIEKEELKKKLEELSKKQSAGKRNLEQLLELTKRYYVTEKANQLAKELDNLSKQQQQVSQIEANEKFDAKQQQKINSDFKKIDKELNQLMRDNKDLKKPLDFEIDGELQKQIKEDQQKALDEIDNHQNDEPSRTEENSKSSKSVVQQKMNSSSNKMKQLSESLQQSASASGGSTLTEDAEMLRQILDNLVIFSFKQEALFDIISTGDDLTNEFGRSIKKQQELKKLFEHVDDSLFALSLRRAELAEFVNEQITEVYYNVDKALETISENRSYQAASYQQYVLTASNNLADFLANALNNMQQSMMSGQGQGQGGGFQLPDIIKAQQSLSDQIGKQSGKGEQVGQGKDGNQQGQQGKNSSGEGKEGSMDKQDLNKQTNGTRNDNGQGGVGKGSNQSNGDGELNEDSLSEIYEIYKEQQIIRQQLEEQLQHMLSKTERDLAKRIALQMEQFENDLLENGITQRTQNKMNNIKHQLLKLENASLKQGKKQERESETNENIFEGNSKSNDTFSKPIIPTVEILNREVIPLHQDYKQKVKGYFERTNSF